jgi:hypothetical protein
MKKTTHLDNAIAKTTTRFLSKHTSRIFFNLHFHSGSGTTSAKQPPLYRGEADPPF